MLDRRLQLMVDRVDCDACNGKWASGKWLVAKNMCSQVCFETVDDAVLDLMGVMIEAIEQSENERMTAPDSQQVGGDHYRKMRIQPVEFAHANGLHLEKAIHFLQLLIQLEYDNEPDSE